MPLATVKAARFTSRYRGKSSSTQALGPSPRDRLAGDTRSGQDPFEGCGRDREYRVTLKGPSQCGARIAGVSWNAQEKRWRAFIYANAGDGESKARCLRSFVNEVDAALAYDQSAREYHKDKAKLNFPDLPPQPQGGSVEMSPKWTRDEQVRPSKGHQRPLTCSPKNRSPHQPLTCDM
jgi:hypothetical protein